MRNSSNLLSNTNKDINQLLDYANKSLNMINQKKTEISELIKTIENYTLSNSQIPIKIESVSFVFNIISYASFVEKINKFFKKIIINNRIANM